MLNVQNTRTIGGIVGGAQRAKIVNCTNYGSIGGTVYVGSIAGTAAMTEVQKCQNFGVALMAGVEAGLTGVEDVAMLAPDYHVHSFGAKYETSEGYHWKECSCGNRQYYGPHTFGKAVSISETQVQKTCTVCGYVLTETVSAPGDVTEPSAPDDPGTGTDEGNTGGNGSSNTGGASSSQSIKAGIQKTTIKAQTVNVVGGAIRVVWKKSAGYKVDHYQVFRSTKKTTGYGTKAFYTTKTGTARYYTNTKNVKKGTRYYYKVRGVRLIDGKKVYTQWSNIAYRKAI